MSSLPPSPGAPSPTGMGPEDGKKTERRLFGLTRRQRFRVYGWGAILLVLGFIGWSLLFLRPDRWYTYTDQVSFEQVAKDVKPGFVLWDQAEPAAAGFDLQQRVAQPVVSSDGARMIYSTGTEDGDANLFLRIWDGTNWGGERPLRALNSVFHEQAPALSGDGRFLYFATDRPGGRGGFDIWVAKWDGVEYAWPLPLTGRVNTGFDEVDPALSPDNFVLYFASNRPRERLEGTASPGILPDSAEIESRKVDYDLYACDIASETPYDLIVERQLSMLYSLREGALADPEVMRKLGGSAETEAAVDRGLAFLARIQEDDGRWDIGRHGGRRGHDVAATAFALLAFYGRGEMHTREGRYRDTVARGLQWLLSQQDGATGDTRGPRPQGNAMYDHGIAALALVEAYGVTKDPEIRPRAQAAIDFISDSQHAEGGWRYQPGERGDLSVTGWMIMALASAKMSGIRVDPETVEGATRFLQHVSSGRYGGHYGYTGPDRGSDAMNAAGFFCAQLLGFSSNSPRAYESAAKINQQGVKIHDLYYAYYGTVAAYQHQGATWRSWMATMQPAFLKTQQRDGSWAFGHHHSGAMGRVIGTALATLCLEAHYRYTPLYGLGFEPDASGPSEIAVDQAKLPETPLYRHAKHLDSLNSLADDRGPVVTDHGDFLYFASARPGGAGGSDLYRSRISGPEPSPPKNLGSEINSAANETNPAVRMAGFHLFFNSDRDANGDGLYSAKSRRVVRRFDYSKLPSGGWLAANAGWIIALLVACGLFVWLTGRALCSPKASNTFDSSDLPPAPSADDPPAPEGAGASP